MTGLFSEVATDAIVMQGAMISTQYSHNISVSTPEASWAYVEILEVGN